jgi:hypothetical protein
MNTILFGNNLCNLLSNKVITEFDKIEPSHITDIKVIDLENFVVIKGRTTINKSINYSKVFKNYFDSLCDNDKVFNVIDLIDYGNIPSNELINVHLTSLNQYDMLMDNFNYNSQGEYHIIHSNNTILYSNDKLFQIINELKEYKDFKGKKIIPSYPFVSDSIYGKNLNSSKLYETYLKYISYNILEKQICREIELNLYHEGDINNISWETLELEVSSNNCIVSNEWLKSLILDIFDFNPNHIKKHLSLETHNFENEILSKDKCWMKRDKTSEMILL